MQPLTLEGSKHSWVSASKKLTPASASKKLTPASGFRYQWFQSGTEPEKCRTALAWSGTGPVPASLVFSFQYRTDQMLGSLAFRHLYTRTLTQTLMHTHTHTHTYDEQDRTWTGTWTCSMDMDMHHGHGDGDGDGDGQAPWMPECRNAEKKFSPASLVFR